VYYYAQDAIEAYNRGLEYLDYNEPDQAVAAFTEALHLNPRHVHAWFARGCAWAERRDPERAVADYTEALRLDSGYAAAYLNRATAYEQIGRRDLADADRMMVRQMKESRAA
jgi:Tfp pilus assembly protein PilF